MDSVNIVLIIIGVVFVALVIVGFYDWHQRRKMYEKLDDPIEESPAVAIGAVVVSKRANIQNMGGPKYPHSTLCCYATFSTDAGEMVELSIPQEVYNSIKENDYGTLVTVEGKFFAFGDGEVINE
ncbi:MAG: DUF2500 family protein [Clostridia bacterium]|nr:DUF2500 family protein [Clostridia bacterium]